MKTAFLLCALAMIGPSSRNTGFVFHHENVLGTSLEIRIDAGSQAQADRAEAAALGEIDRLAAILSTYDSSAEASRWLRTQGTPVRVSAELFEVLSQFDAWRVRTGGTLDPASEAISQIWKSAEKQQRTPSAGELRAAAESIRRQQHWSLDAEAHTATHLSDVPLRFNSFAKIYIVDRAGEAAMRADEGVRAAVVNIGGDLVVKGARSETVEIADPANPNAAADRIVVMPGMAVATSGGYRRGFDIGGTHYSHILDARTGLTAESIDSATVVAPSAVDAGALATAMTILSPAESERLVAAYVPAAEYLLIARDGPRIASRGWYAMQSKSTAAATPATLGARKLTVNFELARIDAQRYRRPYVAVWMEDQDKFPVRTMALWYEKPRWLPDLRAWHRGDRLRALAEGNEITSSVSSATRSPGKYSVDWDGKDNQGKPLKAGKYTVCLEVAREHGSYQLIRQDVDLRGGAKQIPLQANAEVASASIEIR